MSLNNNEKILLKTKLVPNVILESIRNTDFENELIAHNAKNFYEKDKVLKDIFERRKESPLEFLLKESQQEYLTENLAIISSRIGDKIKEYIEEDSKTIGIKKY